MKPESFCHNFIKYEPIFNTGTPGGKFATKRSLKTLAYVNRFATLLCEILIGLSENYRALHVRWGTDLLNAESKGR